MDERTYLTILYDYYGELFNDKQQKYFIDYYFNNLSLGEMSENYEVSRNAIHKQLKNIEVKLKEYEEKLKLYYKGLKLESIINDVSDKTLIARLKELE